MVRKDVDLDEAPSDAKTASARERGAERYSAPRLRRFGKLADLTQGGVPLGKNDPGGSSTGNKAG